MPCKCFRMRLGRRLRAARLSLGFGAEDFAEELGIKPEAYERIEQGERCPPLGTLVQVAQITGKSLDFLLTGRSFDEPA